MKTTKKQNRKWNEVISWTVRSLLLVALFSCSAKKEYESIFLIVLTIGLTFYPNILEKQFRVYLPSSFQIVITLFIFAAGYLGELKDFYDRFWWWDTMLHGVSGLILGIIGFMIVYLLNERYDTDVQLSPFFIVLFAFCFAVTIGLFWEFYEFGMDRLFGLDMQKYKFVGEDGLVDTMKDLLVDSAGAFITSILGYMYIKEKHDLFFTKLFSDWVKRNKVRRRNKILNKEKFVHFQ